MKDSYQSLPAQVIELLEAIRADNRSGAAEILGMAAAVYYAAAGSQAGLSRERALLMADSISSALGEAQPGMAGLLNLAREVKEALKRFSGDRPLEFAARTASGFAESASRKAAASAAQGSQLISENSVVLTHSRSSTVLAALLNAAGAGRRFALLATESRPMFEGRQLAETVSRAGIHVTGIVDAAAALVMDTVDVVLVGADRVTPGHVLNKVGTRMIALAARDLGIPVYSLADTSKFIGHPPTGSQPNAPDAEVWPDHPPAVSVINRYFEEVPVGLFTAIVTERGPLLELTPDLFGDKI